MKEWKSWGRTAIAVVAVAGLVPGAGIEADGVGKYKMESGAESSTGWRLSDHWSYKAGAWFLKLSERQAANRTAKQPSEQLWQLPQASPAAYGTSRPPSVQAAQAPATIQEASAMPESGKKAEPSPLIYQISSGDTLYRIARAFDIRVQDLLAANKLPDPNKLRIGQLLAIPGKVADWSGENERPVVMRVLQSTLTAYTAGKESTGKEPGHPAYGITRSGSKAEEGRTIAVDPAVIPLGTTVLIEGIGIRTAEDTGSAIKGTRIDVFMNDLQEALQFGVQKERKVYVLESQNT